MSFNQSDNYKCTIIKSYIKALVIGVAVFCLGTVLVALILQNNNKETAVLRILPYILLALGGFTAAVSAYKSLRERGFLNGLIAGVLFAVVIFSTICICLNFEITAKLIIIFPICLVAGFVGGITAANTKI